MIRLTRFSGDPIFVNSELIETVECTPDTVLTLVSGNRLTVQESPAEIADLFREFRQSLWHNRNVRNNDGEIISR